MVYYIILTLVAQEINIIFQNCELVILAYSNSEINSNDRKKNGTTKKFQMLYIKCSLLYYYSACGNRQDYVAC